MRFKCNKMLVLFGVLVFISLCFIFTELWNEPDDPVSAHISETESIQFSVWPSFQVPQSEQLQKRFKQECLPYPMKLNFSIANLKAILSLWAEAYNSNCSELLRTFHTIYSVNTRGAPLILPKPFKDKVRTWLGSNEKLFDEVYAQEVIHVVNLFTQEHTIFNPLRDKRPVHPPDQPEAVYYDNILKESQNNCDFCNFRNYTAEHVFHRVENQYAFSASNTFKMDTLHALFALKQHNPLSWSFDAFIGLMELTNTWFSRAQTVYPLSRFPSLVWDVLPRCGASQVHPHLHGFLDPMRYHGVIGSWRHGAQEYFSKTSANFYTDMAKVSASLGLAVTHKSAVAFASLVPRKDHEVVVMAPKADTDFFEMVYFVLRAFVDDLKKFCFSMGLAYPALNGSEAVIPAYARIITRGVVTDIRADISSLELFTATNVNIDPFEVAKLVRDSVRKRRTS